MGRYHCILYFEYSLEKKNWIWELVNKTGFEITDLNIYFSHKEKDLDLDYNLKSLEKHFLKGNCFSFSNVSSDSNHSKSLFRLQVSSEIFSLEWWNDNLDFLFDQGIINDYVIRNGLICGFCFDFKDAANQSNVVIRQFEQNYPGRKFKTKIDRYNKEVIDKSQHWGRTESGVGINFIAAPIMWFGGGFEKFIPLLKISEMDLPINKVNNQIIRIDLFDLYEDPDKYENREKQKRVWELFEFDKIANKMRIEAGFTARE
jgi:hypothetical protein